MIPPKPPFTPHRYAPTPPAIFLRRILETARRFASGGPGHLNSLSAAKCKGTGGSTVGRTGGAGLRRSHRKDHSEGSNRRRADCHPPSLQLEVLSIAVTSNRSSHLPPVGSFDGTRKDIYRFARYSSRNPPGTPLPPPLLHADGPTR